MKIKENLVWIVGAGNIGLEYSKVLNNLKVDYEVIGRGKESAKFFHDQTGLAVKTGGIKKNLNLYPAPKYAIVCVGISELYKVTKELILSGTKNILIEKPGASNLKELKHLRELSKKKNTKLFVAYNRRFFQTVLNLKKIASNDGGFLTAFFDFGEKQNRIKNLKINSEIKKKWIISNSSHVIDLFIYLCGKPKNWKYWHGGSIGWHPSAAQFCGSGKTNKAVFFSYISDWMSPGRWNLVLTSLNYRFILKPMEEIRIMKFKDMKVKQVYINSRLDKIYKPGFYLQTMNFLKGKEADLCDISTQIENYKIYKKIGNYK